MSSVPPSESAPASALSQEGPESPGRLERGKPAWVATPEHVSWPQRSLRAFTLIAVALWFGGFTCYTAFVLRIGNDVVGGLDQGYITQRVTDVLNVLAGVMVAAVLIDLATQWRRFSRRCRALGGFAFMLMLVSLIASIILHDKLDAMLDPATLAQPRRSKFMPVHSRYALASTFLWCGSLIYLVMMTPRPAAGSTGKA